MLSGGASDAEVSLPYLPFVEAIGNYLDEQDHDRLREALGPALGELGQLFPTLAGDRLPEPSPDPGQAKLRLFESIVSLLALPARDRTVLLVIEDVHWADASTRELLDYLARRLTDLPSLIVVTYRTDELHRRHPFLPTLQGWRRSDVADLVELEPLSEDGIGEMLAAILGPDDVDRELHELMLERTEGNPFVLEEMLREVVESSGSGDGGDRVAVGNARLPESVRQAILLRVRRLGDERSAVLEAAAALGRSFDAETLLAVSGEPSATVHDTLETAMAQQLIEEDPAHPGRYSWRHALTQEAIYAEIVTPRRQAIHSRAAEVLADSETTRPVDLANHLLGAARFAEAVPICLRSAEEAEHSLAFGEAVSVLERVLPYVQDPLENARILCRIGDDHQRNGEPATAVGYLSSGIDVLEGEGEELDAAHYRLILGRCHWESRRPDAARAEYELALGVLEADGPSADLAMAHQRLAGLEAFQLDYRACLASAQRAVEIAEQVGADHERVWALGFLALGYVDGSEQERGLALLDECFLEARGKGYSQIASNVAWNTVWTRTHMMLPELEEWLERLESLPFYASYGQRIGDPLCRCYVATARGDLEGALDQGEAAARRHGRLGFAKMEWRALIQTAQILAELGRGEEAAEMLPPISTRTELQDITYDAAARIRVAQSLGRSEDALEVAEEIVEKAEGLATFRETLALAAEVLAGFGRDDRIEELVSAARGHPTEAGSAYLDQIEGFLALARGDASRAAASFDALIQSAEDAGYPLVKLRGQVQHARALGAGGGSEDAEAELRAVAESADRMGARLIASEARAAAAELGVELPPAPERGRRDGPRAGRPARRAPRDLAVRRRAGLLGAQLERPSRRPYGSDQDALPAGARRRRAPAGDRRQVRGRRRDGDVQHRGHEHRPHCRRPGGRARPTRPGADHRAAARHRNRGRSRGGREGHLRRQHRGHAVRRPTSRPGSRRRPDPGEILLSAEAHRRVADWLADHGMETTRAGARAEGLRGPQLVHRLAARSAVVLVSRQTPPPCDPSCIQNGCLCRDRRRGERQLGYDLGAMETVLRRARE